MTNYLFFDTETTGFPKSYSAPVEYVDNLPAGQAGWPRIVQLAWLFADEDGDVLAKGNHIIKPVGFTIPEGMVHGITTDQAIKEGVAIGDALADFLTDLMDADAIVCHNYDFDAPIVGAEMWRLWNRNPLPKFPAYCTMKQTTEWAGNGQACLPDRQAKSQPRPAPPALYRCWLPQRLRRHGRRVRHRKVLFSHPAPLPRCVCKSVPLSRHHCTVCGAKRTASRMVEVYSPVFKKTAWICTEHASNGMDIFSQRASTEKPVFVELFSGSGHIAAAAQQRGFDTVTVDIEARFNPDICIDITNLRRSELPGRVDVVWASVPCTVYSILNLANHWEKICIGYRRYYYSPKTPQALEALRILAATIRLIKKLRPLYYFIENPRGALRHMPHMAFVPFRRSVHYSDYGFEYPKPTDIFTNCPHFTPIEPTSRALNGHAGVMGLSDAYERSLVPPELIGYLMECLGFLVGEGKEA